MIPQPKGKKCRFSSPHNLLNWILCGKSSVLKNVIKNAVVRPVTQEPAKKNIHKLSPDCYFEHFCDINGDDAQKARDPMRTCDPQIVRQAKKAYSLNRLCIARDLLFFYLNFRIEIYYPGKWLLRFDLKQQYT
jgi:hypothetical protein